MDSRLFRRMCNLQCAIEELWFPFPQEFRRDFTGLGFRCLKPNVFLQFVEHGTFEITVKFVKQIVRKLSNNDDDRKFKYLLLGKLPEELGIKLLEELDTEKVESLLFLLDYKLRKQRSTYKREELVDMDTVISNDFLPLYIYLESLKTNVVSSTASTTISPSAPGICLSELEFAWIHRQATSTYNVALGLGNSRAFWLGGGTTATGPATTGTNSGSNSTTNSNASLGAFASKVLNAGTGISMPRSGKADSASSSSN